MKYAYTHVECGPCIMDLLEENDDLSMVHYTSISTEQLEQAEVIEDDCARHILFNVETVCNSGNWFNLQDTKDCCNVRFCRTVSVTNAGRELGGTVVWSMSCKKTAKEAKTTRSW